MVILQGEYEHASPVSMTRNDPMDETGKKEPQSTTWVLVTVRSDLLGPPRFRAGVLVSPLVEASLVALMVKNLPAMQETQVQSLDWEDPLKKEMATNFSILAWEIPWTEEHVRLQSMGSQSLTQLSNFYLFFLTSGGRQGLESNRGKRKERGGNESTFVECLLR